MRQRCPIARGGEIDSAPLAAHASPASALEASAYRFGRFSLEPGEHRLLSDGKPVPLGARGFDLLVALVARAGRLVTKNELLSLVWPGLVVEENNLQVQISALRKLLGPSALATIPGRGYRFELPVESAAHAGRRPDGPQVAEDVSPPGPSRYGRAAGTRRHQPAGATAGALRPGRGCRGDQGAPGAHVEVTVVGAGGIGKTRVAQAVSGQLAVERAAEFPDGVWWVDLAPVFQRRAGPSAVARVLGTLLSSERPRRDHGGGARSSPPAPRARQLRARHRRGGGLRRSSVRCRARVRVLATSQETLKVADEHVYRLGVLALPRGDAPGEAMRREPSSSSRRGRRRWRRTSSWGR